MIVCHQLIHYGKETQNHSFHILPLKALNYYEYLRNKIHTLAKKLRIVYTNKLN
jgi:hypothetical protein